MHKIMNLNKMLVCIIISLLSLLVVSEIIPSRAMASENRIVDGKGTEVFSVVSGESQISKNANGIGVNIKTSAPETEIKCSEEIAFTDLKVAVALNTQPGENLQIRFLIADRADVASGKHLQVTFDRFSVGYFETRLELINADGMATGDSMTYSDCMFLSNSFDLSKNNVAQFSFGKGQKFAFGVEGVEDGSLLDFLFFRGNEKMVLDEDYEILADTASDSLFAAVTSWAEQPLHMMMQVVNPDAEEVDLDFYQVGTDLFYSYSVVPSAYAAGENTTAYSKASIKWNVNDYQSLNYEGYVLERYYKEDMSLEKRVVYNTKMTSFYSDTQLKQDTDYVYRITAYDGLENPVPTLVYRYDDCTIHTKAGSLMPYLIGLLIFVVVFGAFTYVYVNWFDIKKKIANRKQKQDSSSNDKSEQ